MNFKTRLCVLGTFLCAFVLISSHLYSLKCDICNCSVSKNCTSLQTIIVVDNPEHNQLVLDGWVRDCITWDKRLGVPHQQDISLRDFIMDSSLGDGEGELARRKTFQKIYTSRDWPANDTFYHGLKVSGPGAILRHAQGVIATLHSVVSQLKTHLKTSSLSLLDIPCGDLQWMPNFLDYRPEVVYTGADVVADIIEHHRKKFSRLQNASFIVHDIVSTRLKKSYDLILVRDLLQHLWLADAITALKQISDSGSHFLLATTFTGTSVNEDVDKRAAGGRKSEYNLELPPFSLEPPICISYDWNTEKLGLWALPLKQKM